MTIKKISGKAKNAESSEKIQYYEKIWKNHCKGFVRDHVATGIVRDLIDFFVLASITDKDGKEILSPFENNLFRDLIVAGSGFGKTTLLHMMLLCCLTNENLVRKCPCIKETIKGKEEKYQSVKNALFGKSTINYFPVFIDSNEANNNTYTSLLDLAEGKDIPSFSKMIDEANKNGTLLFLIDSIDEVEAEKRNNYIDALDDLIAKYDNACLVLTSRFSGKKDYRFKCDKLYLNELKEADINTIAFSILSEDNAKEFMEHYKKNEHLRALTRNPFALLTVLENKGEYHIIQMIELMVNAIVERRWIKYDYEITRDNIKLLLGFLACAIVFGDREHVDITEISQIFNKAKDNLKLNRVPYDIPKKRLDYFLGTLSNQSGILNIKEFNNIEEYVFQDELVSCWLAANYIYNVISESNEIHDHDGMHGIWSNMCWLDNFVRSFTSESKNALSKHAVYALVMSLVLCSKTSGLDMQKMFLSYLICRDATSVDAVEQNNISKGYKALIDNEFGENDLTNLPEGESRKIIDRMLSFNHNQNLPDFTILAEGETTV